MTRPGAVITRPLTFGPAWTIASGAGLAMRVVALPSRDLVWRGTGSPGIALEENFDASTGLDHSIEMPVTDQVGYGDGNGNLIDVSDGKQSHLYQITIEYLRDGQVVKTSTTKWISVPQGDGSPIDLDDLIPVSTAGGVTVFIPDTWDGRIEELEAQITTTADFLGSEMTRTGSPLEVASSAKIPTVAADALATPKTPLAGATQDLIAAKSRPALARTAVPLVVFMDDDGRDPAWSVLRPLFAAQGIKASFAITTDLIDTGAGHLTWAQVRTLRDEGHEIVNHSKTHADLAAANAALAKTEIVDPLAKFHSEGIYPEGYVYPNSTSNLLVRNMVRNFHRYSLGGIAGGGGTRVPIWTYAIARTLINAASVLGDLTALVDQYVATPGVLVFFTHSTDINTTTLNALIDYVQAANVEIVTAGEAAQRYANVLDVGDAPSGLWTGIGADGKPAGFDGLVRQPAAIAQTTPASAGPDTYPAGVIDVRSISNSQTDWPTPNQPCTVYTNRLVTSHPSYAVQRVEDNAGRIFVRRGATTTTWGAFNSADKVAISGTQTFASLYSDFNQGVTIQAMSGGPGTDGQGTLTTVRSNAGTPWGTFQLWNERNGGPMSRRTPTSGGWSPWKVLAETGASGTAAPTTTPKYVGEEYYDQTAKKWYKAGGTTGSADWLLLN